MECLHRFFKECIDKSMRLGNNECPTCRIHVASRRSLRDDINFDRLIAKIFPDIDVYEKEELALRQEEVSRNKQVQASIDETFKRQSKALGKRRCLDKDALSPLRRSSRGRGRGRGRGGVHNTALPAFDDDEEDNNADDCEQFSSDEPSPNRKRKRCRRKFMSRPLPASATSNAASENIDSPFTFEMPVWGKNGTRSRTRLGNSSASSSRVGKSDRMNKLADYLHNLNEKDEWYYQGSESSRANLKKIPTSGRQPAVAAVRLLTFGVWYNAASA